MENELIQKVTNLVNELALQQQQNQKLALELSKQITDLKQKTATNQNAIEAQSLLGKSGIDQTVSVPLVQEQRDEKVELLKNRLEKALTEQNTTRQRNEELEKEREDLQRLITEYEESLETVTNKFRIYANDVSEGQAQLRREYNALLEAEKGTTTALFMENMQLQTQLSQLAKTLRIVHESGSLDDIYLQKIAQLEQEKKDLLDMVGLSVQRENTPPVLPVTKATGGLDE